MPLLHIEPIAVVGQFLMQVFTHKTVKPCLAVTVATPPVLGTSLVLDLEEFPELDWLIAYFASLTVLQSECDRVSLSIQAIAEEGDIYRNCWIEPYTKTKHEKQYTYYQLRWLTGERKKSGQPKVKTKHLSHRAMGEVRSAIARGDQIEALEQQRQQIETEIVKLKQLIRGTGRRLERMSYQTLMTNPSNNSHRGCLR